MEFHLSSLESWSSALNIPGFEPVTHPFQFTIALEIASLSVTSLAFGNAKAYNTGIL